MSLPVPPGPTVRVRRESVVFPTYDPMPADKNPMFLERRVYQGSRGTVYPLPFYDRIAETSLERTWQAVILENDFVHLMILPEIGGRIHVGRDLLNGYDFFYRQHSIKPALVGLAGPWISGGVEFNWPQHHRPATYLPVDVEIEAHADGSKTVWLGDHDPIERMKGMHGVCLHPGSSRIELKVRAYNRTRFTQTFLWWANVAARVHEQYQSFFPPDVSYVADHAKRATATYPRCDGTYYGVDYGERARTGVPAGEQPANFLPPGNYPANDLGWYANIPVPTSYMAMGSKEDFFGGYDHRQGAGFIHVANHHISPGKKQWTWGNQEFGYAWDRNLSDDEGPYIELMTGVYTDNQPDFSFLQPGETKTWSQYWYPLRQIGVPQAATVDAALSVRREKKQVHVGVFAPIRLPGATVTLFLAGKIVHEWTVDLGPDAPFVQQFALPHGPRRGVVGVAVTSADGRTVVSYRLAPKVAAPVPAPATEPPRPAELGSADELYVTGLHLSQYRHATRSPLPYWQEALRRDPGDSRCNAAIGSWHLRRGESAKAEGFFRAAIARLTSRNPNPSEGEAFYGLGLTLRQLGRDEEAYAALYKSTWNHAWQAAGYHAVAEIDCTRGNWEQALDHLQRALTMNADNLRARNLRVMVLRKLGRAAEAADSLKATRALDRLDAWARSLDGETIADAQVALDLALDLAAAGLDAEGLALLTSCRADTGTGPLVAYTRGWLHGRLGQPREAKRCFSAGAAASPDYCFPARLEEIEILQRAIEANARDSRAPYYLGNLLYDRRRHGEAIRCWERSVAINPRFSVAWRNLGIGYFNVARKPAKAKRAYDHALRANPGDARVLFERDQLWRRLKIAPSQRLRELLRYPGLVAARDDLSVELCALYNQAGQPEKAAAILASRKFQPWEGGEGQALGQHIRTHLLLGQRVLREGRAQEAVEFFERAASTPRNLGEARHLLANGSDVVFWLGEAAAAVGDPAKASRSWETAANFKGDFQAMRVRLFSELTYYSALALARLGQPRKSKALLRELLAYGRELESARAEIDYFATSLPTMLLFEEDLDARQKLTAWFLQAQALHGLGERAASRRLLARVLAGDPNHAAATDFQRSIA